MPKLATDLRSICRSHTEACVKSLAYIVAQGKNENARVNAATQLLDRGWGKAAQVHTDGDGGPIQIVIRQIVDIIEHSEPVTVIEHMDRAK